LFLSYYFSFYFSLCAITPAVGTASLNNLTTRRLDLVVVVVVVVVVLVVVVVVVVVIAAAAAAVALATVSYVS
jgi:hypothetical protein